MLSKTSHLSHSALRPYTIMSTTAAFNRAHISGLICMSGFSLLKTRDFKDSSPLSPFSRASARRPLIPCEIKTAMHLFCVKHCLISASSLVNLRSGSWISLPSIVKKPSLFVRRFQNWAIKSMASLLFLVLTPISLYDLSAWFGDLNAWFGKKSEAQ